MHITSSDEQGWTQSWGLCWTHHYWFTSTAVNRGETSVNSNRFRWSRLIELVAITIRFLSIREFLVESNERSKRQLASSSPNPPVAGEEVNIASKIRFEQIDNRLNHFANSMWIAIVALGWNNRVQLTNLPITSSMRVIHVIHKTSEHRYRSYKNGTSVGIPYSAGMCQAKLTALWRGSAYCHSRMLPSVPTDFTGAISWRATNTT